MFTFGFNVDCEQTMSIPLTKCPLETDFEVLPISKSHISYNQLAQDNLMYLNDKVRVVKSLCSGSKPIDRGKPSRKEEEGVLIVTLIRQRFDPHYRVL